MFYGALSCHSSLGLKGRRSESADARVEPQLSAIGSFGDFQDWREGRVVDRCCLKKVVCAAGLASYSGDAEGHFASIRRHLSALGGFDETDFLEATYNGAVVEGEWRPLPYHVKDAQSPIERSVLALARELEWYRERLPATRFFLLGYSLGGVIVYEAAAWLLSHDVGGWRRRLAGVATLSSPLLGVDFGVLARLARSVAGRPDFYGAAGVELVRRAGDPETVGQMESAAALLRASGVRLLVVVDRNDAVITPGDAVLPSARRAGEVVTISAPIPPHADAIARRFGHGPVLHDETTLRAVMRLVGTQECLGPHQTGSDADPVEAELTALREQLRRDRPS